MVFRIFDAKKSEKESLYPELLKLVHVVYKQANCGLEKIQYEAPMTTDSHKWRKDVKHYCDLMLKVIDHTKACYSS